MKRFKFVVISLIAILFFTGCNKNKNSNEEKIAEKKKIEESEKPQVNEPEIKLFIARENLGESSEKFPQSEIIGDLSLNDYERIFMGVSFNDKLIENTENKAGDLTIFSHGRIVKLSSEKVDGIYKNEEIRKENSKIIESKGNLRTKALELLISNKMREIEKLKNPGEYETYYTYLVKDFFEDGKLIFLTSIKNSNFSFKDGIFKEESGYVLPVELQYTLNEDKNFAFDKKIEAEDGANYGPSLKKMARDDQAIFDVFLDDRSGKDYDKLMEDLLYVAQEKGLDNFTHKLEEIPGYEKDVVYIKDGPNHIPGTVEIAKKKDYEEAKNSVGKVNWSYCEGVVYHEKTGIAVKTVIDYFE